MPTYINDSNYMQMNRLPMERRQPNRGIEGPYSMPSHFPMNHEFMGQDLNCKQVLQHVQNCPVCQHIFTLKTPSSKLSLQMPTSTLFKNEITIPITTLIVFSILIIVLFIYIMKTNRVY